MTTDCGKHTIIHQIIICFYHTHAICNIKYVLTCIDICVYETLLLWLKFHKITSICDISWLVLTFLSSSNYLEGRPCMFYIIDYEHTVVALKPWVCIDMINQLCEYGIAISDWHTQPLPLNCCFCFCKQYPNWPYE